LDSLALQPQPDIGQSRSEDSEDPLGQFGSFYATAQEPEEDKNSGAVAAGLVGAAAAGGVAAAAATSSGADPETPGTPAKGEESSTGGAGLVAAGAAAAAAGGMAAAAASDDSPAGEQIGEAKKEEESSSGGAGLVAAGAAAAAAGGMAAAAASDDSPEEEKVEEVANKEKEVDESGSGGDAAPVSNDEKLKEKPTPQEEAKRDEQKQQNESKQSSYTKKVLCSMFFCCVLIGAVVAGILLPDYLKKDEDKDVTPGGLPLAPDGPTSAPTIQLAAPQTCQEAEIVTDGSSIAGSTKNAFSGRSFPPCSPLTSNGYGVWFKLIGDGQIYQVNTCDDFTNFETKITVFEGTCSFLKCNSANEAGKECGAGQSKVQWSTNPDQEYYIFVHGDGVQVGDFKLNVELVTQDNLSCDKADLAPSSGLEEIIGNTWSATQNANGNGTFTCSEASPPGLWYAVDGDGSNIAISTCSPSTNYDAEISIAAGSGCDELVCVEATDEDFPSEGTIKTFFGAAGTTYYVQIHGNPDAVSVERRRLQSSPADSQFGMIVQSNVGSNGFLLSPLESCESAVALEIDGAMASGTLYQSSSSLWDSALKPPFCESSGQGVFYTINGTGQVLTADTCNNATDFDTTLTVLTGTCSAQIYGCIASNDQFCGDQSSVKWTANLGETYYLLVRSVGNGAGNFGLTVNSAPTPAPTRFPSGVPTLAPTTPVPTGNPSLVPTVSPTASPTTGAPTGTPTRNPTESPSGGPTTLPTMKETTVSPTLSPTSTISTVPPTVSGGDGSQGSASGSGSGNGSGSGSDTGSGSEETTVAPTSSPIKGPTTSPTKVPATLGPTESPTPRPTSPPTPAPTKLPSQLPTGNPTSPPTPAPTKLPSQLPTGNPTESPTPNPTPLPTSQPTSNPSPEPTGQPTRNPTPSPTPAPTGQPSKQPTPNPTPAPTRMPATSTPTSPVATKAPTERPTGSPTDSPTYFIDPTDVCNRALERDALGTSDSVAISSNGPNFSFTKDLAGTCGASNPSAYDNSPAIWFKLDGSRTGRNIIVESLECNIAFPFLQLTVFRGDCSSPICVAGTADFCNNNVRFEWDDSVSTYYLMFHGFDNLRGNFVFSADSQ